VPHRPDAGLKHERFSAKISKIMLYSCLSGRPRFTVRTASVHITAVGHLNPQPINRGPWALRTARIRYSIPLELRELFCEVIRADLFSLKLLQVCCCCATTEVYLRGRPTYPSGRSDLIMEIACRISATVGTLGQHRPDTALFRKEFQRIWKASCTVIRLDALSYHSDAA
jgi:hypothetical protein